MCLTNALLSLIIYNAPGALKEKAVCHRACFHFYSDLRKVKCAPELRLISFYFQRNITFISNAAVRETILNVTLSNLHPYFEFFAPEDFQLWFQVYLFTALASFRPDSLVVIPLNISCASYEAM